MVCAIDMGAVERGQRYVESYPGKIGGVFAMLATGVVFVAGAKLLDSVRPVPMVRAPAIPQRRRVSRNRPRRDPRHSAARSPVSQRID